MGDTHAEAALEIAQPHKTTSFKLQNG